MFKCRVCKKEIEFDEEYKEIVRKEFKKTKQKIICNVCYNHQEYLKMESEEIRELTKTYKNDIRELEEIHKKEIKNLKNTISILAVKINEWRDCAQRNLKFRKRANKILEKNIISLKDSEWKKKIKEAVKYLEQESDDFIDSVALLKKLNIVTRRY